MGSRDKLRQYLKCAFVLEHGVLCRNFKAAIQQSSTYTAKMLPGGCHRVWVRYVVRGWDHEVNSWQEALKIKPGHGGNKAASIPRVGEHLKIWVCVVSKVIPECPTFAVAEVFCLAV